MDRNPDPDAARNLRPQHDRNPEKPADGLPPAGPHADPALTNPDATPGAGALTPPGEPAEEDADAASG
jgi:hypothetical protein